MKQPQQSLHGVITGTFRAEHRLWESKISKVAVSKGQPKMLFYLSKNDGCMQKDIAEGTGIEPPSATSILAVMERDGLVRRQQSAEDRRRYHVFFTYKGREKRDEVEKITHQLDKELLEGFTEEEKGTLYALLDRVKENASQHFEAK